MLVTRNTPVLDRKAYERDDEINLFFHKMDHLLAETTVDDATTAAIVANFIFDK